MYALQNVPNGGSKGGARGRAPPSRSNFFSILCGFRGKGQNNGFVTPHFGLALQEILGPPLVPAIFVQNMLPVFDPGFIRQVGVRSVKLFLVNFFSKKNKKINNKKQTKQEIW